MSQGCSPPATKKGKKEKKRKEKKGKENQIIVQ